MSSQKIEKQMRRLSPRIEFHDNHFTKLVMLVEYVSLSSFIQDCHAFMKIKRRRGSRFSSLRRTIKFKSIIYVCVRHVHAHSS